MQELQKLDIQFEKFAIEAKAMDERLHALYEDMGNILSRYYKIADIPTDTMKERLAIKETKKPIKEAKSSQLKNAIFGKSK